MWPSLVASYVPTQRGALDASTSQCRTSGKCSPYVPSGSSPGAGRTVIPAHFAPPRGRAASSWTEGTQARSDPVTVPKQLTAEFVIIVPDSDRFIHLSVTRSPRSRRIGHRCNLGSIRRLAKAAEAAEAKIRDAPRMAEPSPPRRGQSQGASSVASYVGDDRDAWSCPLPNEIFEVGSQGQDEDIAALGVAIALRNHHAWCTPVRHASAKP